MGCKHIQINFVKNITSHELSSFLEKFDDTLVESLKISLPFVKISPSNLNKLFEKTPRLNSIVFYSCSSEKIVVTHPQVFYSKENLNIRSTHRVNYEYFTINISLFSESQKYNTYYNRKLCIDSSGRIKNNIESERSFGSVQDTKLLDVAKSHDFQKLWSITKDEIDVCKDCEYRHMCVDSCEILSRKNGTWYRAKECNYNPYICKWSGQNQYKSLSDSGVTVNSKDFDINHKKLNEVNRKIWGV